MSEPDWKALALEMAQFFHRITNDEGIGPYYRVDPTDNPIYLPEMTEYEAWKQEREIAEGEVAWKNGYAQGYDDAKQFYAKKLKDFIG